MPVPEELREIVAECGEVTSTLWARGWAERNAGNLSVEVKDRLNSPPPEGEDPEGLSEGQIRELEDTYGERFRD